MLRAPVTIAITAAHFIAAAGIDAPGSAVAGVRAVQCKGYSGLEAFAGEELPYVVAQQGRHGCVGPLKVKDVAAAAAGGRFRAGNAEAGSDLAQRDLFCEVDEEIVDEFVGKQVIDLAQRGQTESVKVSRIVGHSRCSQAGWEGCAEEEKKQHSLHLRVQRCAKPYDYCCYCPLLPPPPGKKRPKKRSALVLWAGHGRLLSNTLNDRNGLVPHCHADSTIIINRIIIFRPTRHTATSKGISTSAETVVVVNHVNRR